MLIGLLAQWEWSVGPVREDRNEVGMTLIIRDQTSLLRSIIAIV